MSKRVVAAIALVLAAALVALFFLFERERPFVPPQSGDEGAAAADRRADPPPPTIAAPLESRGVAPIRPAPFVDPAAAAADEPLRVLVLDEATGIPVPGAEVAWTDESGLARGRFGLATPSPLVSDFDHAPQRSVADSRGVAIVRTSERLAVAARSGGRFGLRRFRQAPRGEIRLGIVDGPFIAARVVDGGGAPVAGVMTVISIGSRKANTTWSLGFYAKSRNPDGLAIVHHPGVALEGLDPATITEVNARIEGAPPESAGKATLEQLKTGPITLGLQPTGRVVVRVLDAEGQPFPSDVRVSLTASAARPVSWPSQFEGVAVRGIAEFSLVPVGIPLTVSAEAAELDTVRREKVDGLGHPGEQVTIDLRFVRRRATVRGRALDELGKPLARQALEAELVHGDRALVLSEALRATTDSRGEFRLTLDRERAALVDADLFLQVRDDRGDVERAGGIPLPKLSAEDETDVGEIRLSRPQPLASGIVRDELGAPVAGALVTVANMSSSSPGFEVRIGGRNLPSGGALCARTDEAGAFVIPRSLRSAERISGLGLKAELTGYVCPNLAEPLEPGETGVTIVLQATGTIQGRILLPDLAPVRKLTLQVLVSDCTPGCKPNYVFDDCVDSTGSFRLTGIQPGTAKVDVLMTGTVEPLASVASVLVRRLATADDARLRAIDLRGHRALRP